MQPQTFRPPAKSGAAPFTPTTKPKVSRRDDHLVRDAEASGLFSVNSLDANPFADGVLPNVDVITQDMRMEKVKQLTVNTLTDEELTEGLDPLDVCEKKAIEAMNEHYKEQLDLFDAINNNESILGSGILYYFSFVKFLFIITLLNAGLQSATFGNYIRTSHPSFQSSDTPNYGQESFLDKLMITHYDDGEKVLWYAVNIAGAALSVFLPFLYFVYLKKFNESTKALSDKVTQEAMTRFTSDAQLDVSNQYRGNAELTLRRLLVALVVFAFVGGQVLATWYISLQGNLSIYISFSISIVVAVLNLAFMVLAEKLTEFEKWATFGQWKKYHTSKLLFFKIANVMVVFATMRYDLTGTQTCTYNTIGEQFVTLLLIQVFAMNAVNLILAMFLNVISRWLADFTGSIFGDRDNMPQFDLASLYLSMVYQHYIVTMSMVVCPFSSYLGLVGYAITYWVEKFKMKNSSRHWC